MTGRIGIDEVAPGADGACPAKAVAGEFFPIRATVWSDGHAAVAAEARWRSDDGAYEDLVSMRSANPGLDRWEASVVPRYPGLWWFRVEGWRDPWASWLRTVRAKLAASDDGSSLGNELEEGARLLERRAGREAAYAQGAPFREAAARLRATERPVAERLEPALSDELQRRWYRDPVRELRREGQWSRVWADRQRAAYGAWYELFPRSTGGVDANGRVRHGTFATTAAAVPRIAAMGFDVLYLPPIHPIGRRHRKGPNNAPAAAADDVGSPWAVGAVEGGHDTVHPELGTLGDFRDLVEQTRRHGMEIALDLAFQCAPDHPWVKAHPEWFAHRPDGSVAVAENPPKVYEDIHPLDFDRDPSGLREELARIVRFWIANGVRIFRVDNPHTKPMDLWHSLISEIRAEYPDVVFLAEAFTRPPMVRALGKLGFSQGYTYFTWRETKAELTEYLRELVRTADHFRPNLFVNTPDILPATLRGRGRAAFEIRATLAAMLSPSWGVYSGYEVLENEPLRPGSEEYLDSEKYQLRHRDFGRALRTASSVEPWITRLNRIRRAHPAVRQLRSLRFHEVDNEHLLAFSRADDAVGDAVICVVNLDPLRPQEGELRLDPSALLDGAGDRSVFRDEVTGEVLMRGTRSRIRLRPEWSVAAILTVTEGWA